MQAQHLPGVGGLVRAALLQHDAHVGHDLLPLGDGVEAEDADRPGVRSPEALDALHRGGLARAVRPEQRDDRARLHAQRHPVHDGAVAVALDEVDDLDRGVHGSSSQNGSDGRVTRWATDATTRLRCRRTHSLNHPPPRPSHPPRRCSAARPIVGGCMTDTTPAPEPVSPPHRRLALVFPGQGSQQPGMAGPWVEPPRLRTLGGGRRGAGRDVSRLGLEADDDELREPGNCQIALFVHGVVLLEAWRWGRCGRAGGGRRALAGGVRRARRGGGAAVRGRAAARRRRARAHPGGGGRRAGHDGRLPRVRRRAGRGGLLRCRCPRGQRQRSRTDRRGGRHVALDR
jgi:hypothetical protein